MKKLWREIRPILVLFGIWRIALAGAQHFAPSLWSLRTGFLGTTPWSNFDGMHYLSIAKHGYFQYEQAFFPLYPLLIRHISSLLAITPVETGLLISHISFVIGLLIFSRLARALGSRSFDSVLFLLAFPTSFFFAAVYAESIFFLLAVACMYATHKKQWVAAGVLGMFASATKPFGIVLFILVAMEYSKAAKKKHKTADTFGIGLIPVGLFAYMWHLWRTMGDPLAFFHAQPAFGAGRSGDVMVLLPQTLWRYAKIIFTADPTTLPYLIAWGELVTLLFGIWLLWRGRKIATLRPYVAYAAVVLLLPTLTGTLSSMPRYFLSAFPLFFILAAEHSRLKKRIIGITFFIANIVFTTTFLRGYFVA